MTKQAAAPKVIGNFVAGLINRVKFGRADSTPSAPVPAGLRIARYNLVLMDGDGQVVWTREWDAGDIIELTSNYSLRIFCEFTNRSPREIDIAEYEIELVGEAGVVLERFSNAFDDPLVLEPGESKEFSGAWRL